MAPSTGYRSRTSTSTIVPHGRSWPTTCHVSAGQAVWSRPDDPAIAAGATEQTMMGPFEIRNARQDEMPQAVATIVAAFITDPLSRFAFASTSIYPTAI